MGTMRAAIVYEPGGPEVLKLEPRPVREPLPGQVLIRVRAFGINRSELFTRQGASPNVRFPRVLGIEAVGTVANAPGGEFSEGAKVATVMGGMGRDFDGGYAEYTCVPAKQVRSFESELPWDQLGALPEMLQTAWGTINTSLALRPGESLLIRGGRTSVGLAASVIAKKQGAQVATTTRSASRIDLLKQNGADQVFLDTGSIAADVRVAHPDGFDKVLEMIGTVSLRDSLLCAKNTGLCA